MKNHSKKTYKNQLVAITFCLAGVASQAHAEQNTKEFLSDPSRVGSLTGTILGGALTAHPVGTLAGSVIGFFVGKQSMFESPEKQELTQLSQAQRSIIPSSPTKTSFAFNPAQPMTLGQTGTVYTSTAQPSATQKISAYCSGNTGNAIDPILQTLCYYRQSS